MGDRRRGLVGEACQDAHEAAAGLKVKTPKVSTTIWLDADIVEYFRAIGPGWQSRINAMLRKAAGL